MRNQREVEIDSEGGRRDEVDLGGGQMLGNKVDGWDRNMQSSLPHQKRLVWYGWWVMVRLNS